MKTLLPILLLAAVCGCSSSQSARIITDQTAGVAVTTNQYPAATHQEFITTDFPPVAGPPVQVIGSVSGLQGPSTRQEKFVTLQMTVHSPADLAGAYLSVQTTLTHRGVARTQYPLGSLQVIQLPAGAVETLKQQRARIEQIEKMIDGGIEAAIISEIVIPTQIRIADLPTPPVSYSPKP